MEEGTLRLYSAEEFIHACKCAALVAAENRKRGYTELVNVFLRFQNTNGTLRVEAVNNYVAYQCDIPLSHRAAELTADPIIIPADDAARIGSLPRKTIKGYGASLGVAPGEGSDVKLSLYVNSVHMALVCRVCRDDSFEVPDIATLFQRFADDCQCVRPTYGMTPGLLALPGKVWGRDEPVKVTLSQNMQFVMYDSDNDMQRLVMSTRALGSSGDE